jgi:cell wall-associated NlpC family hydrolase
LKDNLLLKYIGHKHQYGIFDCIILVQQFYKNELGVSFDLPPYPHSAQWMKEFTTTSFDERAAKYGTKVPLTGAKNYDLIVFKSEKSELLIHFGIYIMPNKMLHVEEGMTSRIDTLSDYWLSHLYAVYRHDSLV